MKLGTGLERWVGLRLPPHSLPCLIQEEYIFKFAFQMTGCGWGRREINHEVLPGET